MSFENNDKKHVMYTKSDNLELIKQTKLLKNFLSHFFKDTKLNWKHQWEVVILLLVVFIYQLQMSQNKSKLRWIIYGFPQLDKKQNHKCYQSWWHDDKCFQYAAAVTLNHVEIGRNSQIISKIKHFINKYNWEQHFPSGKDDWEAFEKNNPIIALNLLYV